MNSDYQSSSAVLLNKPMWDKFIRIIFMKHFNKSLSQLKSPYSGQAKCKKVPSVDHVVASDFQLVFQNSTMATREVIQELIETTRWGVHTSVVRQRKVDFLFSVITWWKIECGMRNYLFIFILIFWSSINSMCSHVFTVISTISNTICTTFLKNN